MHELLNATHLVRDFGYIGVFLIIFLESGIVFGFFLPGDSLLFTAGLLAASGNFNIAVLILLAVAAAILGNNAGYWTGKRVGESLFTRKNSVLFSRKRVAQAHGFFEKYGDQSLVLARFIPAVRTFLPIIAGMAEMRYKSFLIFNAVGGLFWGILLPLSGYLAGKSFPNIDKYILPSLLIIIGVSLVPAMWAHYKDRQKRKPKPPA